MVNQKGQAFSVFELMIAGVVAFAILMVLMQVIGGVGTGTAQDAETALSDAIDATSGYSQKVANNFVIEKGAPVSNVSLALSTDYDPEQILFMDTAIEGITVTGDGDTGETVFRSLAYTGVRNNITISALVICMTNQEYMEKALGELDGDSLGVTLDSAIYSSCPANMTCCVIIPKKKI